MRDRLPARVDDHRGDHDAAERLHERACQPADPGDGVAPRLDLRDRGVEPPTHLGLEGEGLDGADALAGLLDGGDHPRHPLNLRVGELPDLADDQLRAEHDDWAEEQGHEAQERILHHHHHHQPE